jgi:L-amino acid N-acyltransferase YncA
VRIRLAEPDRDAEACAEIYRPAVEQSIVSFEETAPGPAEMAERMRATLRRTPWLVAEENGGRIIGYAYAGGHRERAGYRWSVDISVYVDSTAHGRGIGRALYDELLAILRRQRFVNAYAGIALPNAASEALHRSIGMERIGTYREVGVKFGAWVDVAWFGMRLADREPNPPEPIPLADLA